MDEDAGGLIRKAPLTGEGSEGLLYQRRIMVSNWEETKSSGTLPRNNGAS